MIGSLIRAVASDCAPGIKCRDGRVSYQASIVDKLHKILKIKIF